MNDPRITIGLPVYNGESYLAQAVNSFLQQTYSSFELVIYDNASTDATASISLTFARRDSRVRIIRHQQTISAADNFIAAASAAATPYFCWAAHDDLRHPEFLKTLVQLLDENPAAGLAACGCLEIDPDGSPRTACTLTASLRCAETPNPADRVVEYLRYSPCSPIYGLFRTTLLQQRLDALRDGPQFGADLVFLAGFLARHEFVFTESPLLMLRSGGVSHRDDHFQGLRQLCHDLWTFHRALECAIDLETLSGDRMRVCAARWRLLTRYLASSPARNLFVQCARRSYPWIGVLIDHIRARDRVLRTLKQRLANRPHASRIVIFGAGKHTRRLIRAFRLALNPRDEIVAICDDNASGLAPVVKDIPLIPPGELQSVQPDLIVVSSDTYERTLYRRACELADTHIPVWCLYDLTIETDAKSGVLTTQRVRSHSHEQSAAA